MANGTAAKIPAAGSGDGFVARITKNRFCRFIMESWNETFHKCSWPTKKELTAFTIVVMFALTAVSVYIALIDSMLTNITRQIK